MHSEATASRPVPLTVCVTPSSRAPSQIEVLEFESNEELMGDVFHSALNPFFRAEKDGAAIIPSRPCAPRADGLYEGRDGELTDSPYRRNANFSHVCLGIVDIDATDGDELEDSLERLRRDGIWFVAYPTHSYGRSAKPIRYRVVVPFSEPVAVGSPSRWADHLWPKFMEVLGLGATVAATLKADPMCKDVSRLYYLPSWDPSNELPRPAPEHHRGAPLEVARLFGPLLRAPFARYVERKSDEAIDGTERAYPSEVMRRMKKFKNEPYVSVLKQVESWLVLEVNGSRHEAILALTEMLARVAKPGESSQSLLEVARHSLHLLEQLEPGRDVWGEAFRALRGARAKLDQWDRQQAEERRAKAAAFRRMLTLAAHGSSAGGER